MAEKEDVKPDPDKDTPAEQTKPEPTAAPPDWFYGDKFKTIDDQAQAYKSAVQKEKEAEAENKTLRETNESLIATAETKNQKPAGMSHSDDEISALEAKFGKPYAQIQAEWDMQSLIIADQMKPMKNAILSQQYESTLNRMETDNPLFKKYRKQVESKLVSKPMEERANTQVIKNAWSNVIAENIEDIRTAAIEEGKKSVTASPDTIPDVNTTNKTVVQSSVKTPLSDEEKEYFNRVGANTEAIEKFYNDDLGDKRKSESGWKDMF